MHKPLFLNFPISKIDEEQRVVYGIATSEAIDSQGDVIDYEASKKAFNNWKGNIREMHQPIAVGKAIDIQFDDATKSVTVGAKISQSADGENAWLKVKEGVLTGFSIGGSVAETKLEMVKDGDRERQIRRITDYGLSETSLVDNPANPEALFSMVKSVDGGLQRVEAMQTRKPGTLPAWYSQFMPPIEKAQALYDEGMKKRDSEMKIEKTGAAVMDGDPRDTAGSTVSEDTPAAPKRGGSTVTRDIYHKDNSKTTATKANEETDMQKQANVVDGVERDENAEVVTEDPKPEAEETVEEAPVEEPKTEEAPAEPEAEEAAPAEEAPAEEAAPAEEEAKAVTLGDLKKFSDALIAKLGDRQESDFQKVLGEFTGKVEKSMTDLEGRIKRLEAQPAASKVKASYVEIEKGKEGGEDSEMSASEVEELVKRRDELAANPLLGSMDERIELTAKLRKANALGLLKK